MRHLRRLPSLGPPSRRPGRGSDGDARACGGHHGPRRRRRHQPPPAPRLVTTKVGQHDLVVEPSRAKLLLRLTNEIAQPGPRAARDLSRARSRTTATARPIPTIATPISGSSSTANGDGVFHRAIDTDSEHFKFGCDRYNPHAGDWDSSTSPATSCGGCTAARRSPDDQGRLLHDRHSTTSFPRSARIAACGYYPQGGCDETRRWASPSAGRMSTTTAAGAGN